MMKRLGGRVLVGVAVALILSGIYTFMNAAGL